jgi:hypothetical protein
VKETADRPSGAGAGAGACEVRLVVGWLVSKRVGLVSPHLVGSADSSCFGLSPLTPAPLDMLIDQ